MGQNKFHWHLILLLQDEWIGRKGINIESENIWIDYFPKCCSSYEFRTPIVMTYFCISHLIEEYYARKWYGVLMRYFKDVFIRIEKMAKDAPKKMYLQVASKLT